MTPIRVMEIKGKICDSLKADSLPMPEYTVHPGDNMIKFTEPEDRIVRVNNKVNDRANVHVNDCENADVQSSCEEI